jgi:uncharacterized protein GlcG (DUF336 family)
MYEERGIGLDEAMKVMEAMIQEAKKERSKPMAICIVDQRGEIVCSARMDGCQAFRPKMAFKKAYTAAQYRKSTRELGEVLKAQGLTIGDFALENTTLIRGGEVIFKPGEKAGALTETWIYQIVGAIGTSGGTAIEDEVLAKFGQKVAQSILWPEK